MSEMTGEDFWSDVVGPGWVEMQPRLDAMMMRITARLLDASGASAGERALDVGCGCGETSLALGERVGESGEVIGVDLSRPMLERARQRAAGRKTIRFELADAARIEVDPHSLDLVFSRFGVMFFEDSVAAFRHLGERLKPGGRLVFATWRSPQENPWMTRPMAALDDLLPPPEPPVPDAPGPMRFVDPEVARRVLRDAGLSEIEITPLDEPLTQAGTVDEILTFMSRVGPVGGALEKIDPSQRDEALRRLRDTVTAQHDGEGVTDTSATWIVRASA